MGVTVSVPSLKCLLIIMFVLDIIEVTSVTIYSLGILSDFIVKGVCWLFIASLSIVHLFFGIRGCLFSSVRCLTKSLAMNAVRLIIVFIILFTPSRIRVYPDIMSSLAITQIILTILLVTVLNGIRSEENEPTREGIFITPLYKKVPTTPPHNVQGLSYKQKDHPWSRRRSLNILVPKESVIPEESEEEATKATESPDNNKSEFERGTSATSAMTTTTTISVDAVIPPQASTV